MKKITAITKCESNGQYGYMLDFEPPSHGQHITAGILSAIQNGETNYIPAWYRELDWSSQEQIRNLTSL